MIINAFGLDISGDDAAANAAFDQALHGFAAHQPTVGAALARTLEIDPDHVAALALRGFAGVLLARAETLPLAEAMYREARRALNRRDGGTAGERILVDALGDAARGQFHAAADRLDHGFVKRPTTFLPFRISHALRFMLGDRGGMLSASRRMMANWSSDVPAAGFLAGCHAFALEEHGCYDAAESIGRTAVALQPDDAWGLHAVCHVHEMRGDTSAGIAWLEHTRGHWSACNNFSYHIAWHLALMYLERGEWETVLSLYDEAVRPEQTDDFRDVANAVSLLWRLERRGVNVGGRWAALAAVVRKRRADASLVFATLHSLVALVALGDQSGVDDLLAALEARAGGSDDQSRVAAEIGIPLARLLAGRSGGGRRGPTLDGMAATLQRLGGSNAQRDFFMLALAEAAVKRGDLVELASIRNMRRRLRADDALLAAIEGCDGVVALSA